MKKQITRREFIRTAAFTGAAVVVTTTSACAPQNAPDAKGEVETPSFVYGKDETMQDRILVAYATRTGSTVDVAAAIGETLAGRGFAVDVKPIKDNPSTEGYQKVVLGSAINGGAWLPEAAQYVKDHQQALQKLPVALFCVHIMNIWDDETSVKNRMAYLNPIRALVTPAAEGFFAGMGMKPEETNAVVRWAYRTFRLGGEGDCRDWGKIKGWAEGVEI